MRNVVLGLGISLDGYIARLDGAVDFLFMPRDYSMAPFFATVDTAIMGRKTLDAGLKISIFGSSQMCRIVRVFEMFLTLTIAAACISPVPAQTLHICCNSEDCAKRQVKPNLQLIETTHLFGSLVDPTGRSFRLSKVELRKWVSPTRQVLLKTISTDKDGHFDMGEVETGQYRFLPSETGAFQQPEHLLCPQSECRLELVLRVSTTDTPEAVCPIR